MPLGSETQTTMPNFTLRFYPVRAATSRSGFQTGPMREFLNIGELDDFMSQLSAEARAIAWVTWPDGREEKYEGPPTDNKVVSDLSNPQPG